MKQHLALIAIVVRDYDEAISFYVNQLGFNLIEDKQVSPDKRWVVVAPPGSIETRLLLARGTDERQKKTIGDQCGGRVFLFLHTDNFHRDYETFVGRGVRFVEQPRTEPYGTVAVFEDLYGNRWDLIQHSSPG
jgi:catechol 2,3-dioxygenase-like lactoylglutathione lyase family enzyme